jgi:hypothetical protein
MRIYFTSIAVAIALGCCLIAGQGQAATTVDDGGQLESPSMQVRVSMAQPGIESLDMDGLGLDNGEPIL